VAPNDAPLSLPNQTAAVALEISAWTLLALVAALSAHTYRPAPLLEDSYQYINVAGHIAHGEGPATSLVHFDAERSHGQIPAPLTTFPPGYPLVLAAIGGGRSDFEASARLLSCACFAGTAAFIAWALILSGVTPTARCAVMVLFATNAVALSFATAVLTEPLYMFMSTGTVALLIWAEAGPPGYSLARRAATAHLVAGLAYWVRYAGLFLILALAGYAALRWVMERTRIRTVTLATTAIPAALAGALMLRNIALVGTWKGGNDLTVQNSLRIVAADYLRAQWHLLLGAHALRFGAWEGILLAGLASLALALFRPGKPWKLSPSILLVGLAVFIYSTGLLYAGLRTVISFGTRMFVPVLPLYFILLGVGLSRLDSNSMLAKLALALVIIGSVGVNARDFYDPPSEAPHRILQARFAETPSLLNWVESNIGKNEVISAAGGQPTGYLLRRPTLSLVGAQYSAVRWECAEVQSAMQVFHSKYLILYKPPPSASDDFLLGESRFVAEAASHEPPCGFSVSAENAGVRILKAVGGPR
jgi:hypothetical protein